MYIPYEKIGKLISFFFPEKQKKSISSFFLELKILANCKYIKKKKKNKKIKKKKKTKKEYKLFFFRAKNFSKLQIYKTKSHNCS